MIEIIILILIMVISIILGIRIIINDNFPKPFSISFFIYNIIWCYFPIIATIFRGGSIYPFIQYKSFLDFSLLELIPIIIIQIIIIANNKTIIFINEFKLKIIDLGYIGEGFVLFLCLILTLYFWTIVGAKNTMNYYDINSVQTTQAGSFTDRIIGSVYLLKSLLFGYLYVMILVSGSKTPKIYKVLALFILILDAYMNFIVGSRINLLVPVIILIYYSVINHWPFKAYIPIAILIIIFFFIGGSFAIISGDLRVRKDLSPQRLMEKLMF